MFETFHDSLGRFRGVAIIDVVLSILLAIVLWRRLEGSLFQWLLIVFAIGELLHYYFQTGILFKP